MFDLYIFDMGGVVSRNANVAPDIAAYLELDGTRVVAGTNTIAPHYDIHLRRGDYDIFDIVYASHLMGLAKPDPAFYTCILEHESCSADRAVFIDDFPENVEAARALGIGSLLFTGAEQLKKDLTALAKPAD
jgi:FMN phosphatase YigB (HAD superfamily)